ncbi:MAG: cytochrome-c oxidase, cbb3-type subunit I [Planctomycetota bacterium]|jgi:cytochrome c oxidase cbb3-type subunit I/II
MQDNSGQNTSGQQLEQFTYDDAIVRKFFFATVLWAVVGMAVGLLIAAQLAFPKLNLGLEWFSFGRLRPLHTNAAIFAFAGNAVFTAIYYSTQRLCKARMWSDTLSKLHFWGWQLIIVSAALTLPFGITQGKEYAELEWPIDLGIAVVWLGFFGVNFIMTLVTRRERHMYVALWFYLASIITVTVLHVFNNLSLPIFSGLKSYSIYAGAQDAFMQWWYGHNAVAFFLTTPFLGLMYYFLPKAAEKPVFSYRLSIVHFWSLVFIYIWAGPHHLHYTAIPAWASTLGMLFSVMLWMPSWGGMINGLLTLRGAWNKVAKDPVLKFFVVGVTFYGMSTFEGPLLSIKSVNALSHYTDWTIAHVHGGTLGWNGFMTFGMLYWLAPRLFQAKLWNEKWATTHFWLGTLGIVIYSLPIYVAGITQGLMWRAFDETGRLAYPDFVETSIQLVPFYHARVLGGALYIVGVLMMCWNFYQTWKARPKQYDVPTHEAPALSKKYGGDTHAESRLQANIEFGHKGDKFMQGHWHRVWERKPIKFTIWIVVAIGVASLFEIIPTFLIKSNVPTIASVQPYTPLELYGRDIYIAEGCYNCHSQMIRPIRAETERYGEYSKPGEFVYDHPFQWGSRRIGPDLARVGGKYSHHWHYLHFEDPQTFARGSMMPQYTWFKEKGIAWNTIQDRINAMLMLGVPYGEFVEGGAEEAARAQARQIATELADQAQDESLQAMEDKQVVALIAYLQRLGTDIFKPAPEEAAAGDAAAPPAETNEEAH